MNSIDRSFKDKIVFITGASSGIGEALARGFAKEGAKLGLLARRTDRLQTLVNQCAQMNVKAQAIHCDVTQDSDLTNAVKAVHENLGNIDIVIANAGFGVIDNFVDLTLADFQRQFETNIYGVLRTIYATLDDLKKSKGRLVIVGSVLGHISTPQYTAYSMSKHAITALAETLYAELALLGISVTLISPGYIDTEFRNINKQGIYEENTRDPLPNGLRLHVDKAARIIIEAIRCRKREQLITALGKFAVFMNRLFPSFLPMIFRHKVLRDAKKDKS